MSRFVRHRYFAYLPFGLFFVATVIGGWFNTIELHGRIVDDFTGDGVAATVTHGTKVVTADATGAFVFPNLPRISQLRVDAPGYLRTTSATTKEEVRLSPFALTVAVKEAGVTPDKPIAKADIRQGDKVLATTTASGVEVVNPYPAKDSSVLVCAEGHESKTVPVRGVRLIVELAVGGTGCPALPSPSPSASPSGSPGVSPSPSAAPSPSPSPSP